MHTPQGFEMIDGVAHATDWSAIIFSPSLPYRLTHTLLSSGLTAAFLIAGLLAWRFLRGERSSTIQTGLKVALTMAAVLAPAQAMVGDLHGTNTRDYQPAKLAAMEALWESDNGVPLVLFAMPDEEARTNHAEIAIPKLGSLIITRDPNGHVRGLNEFEGEHPPVAPVFWAFRIMVGTGMAMIVVGVIGAWYLWRRPEPPRWLMKVLVVMGLSGWVATVAGWYVTEIGRQPWLVQGVLKTKDAVADHPPANVGISLVLYLTTYVLSCLPHFLAR